MTCRHHARPGTVDAAREVCGLALAHVNSNRVEAACRCTDLFDRRRVLVADRAAYVA